MKYREVLLQQLASLPYFNRGIIRSLGEQYSLKEATVDAYISRSLARKDMIQLKKGMYVTADFSEKNINDISYAFYVANVLRAPSYVSSWTALQYYDLITEATSGIVSVTSKVTRTYHTALGTFSYQSIAKEFFSGFSLVKGKFDFFVATPSKALFDLLYFKTNQFRGIRFEMITGIVEELRIDIDEMDKKERTAFYSMVENYIKSHG